MGRSGEEDLCAPLPPPSPSQSPKCPRCNSAETKFCYYNNYSTTQPRYFCKDCKRYWTEGGSLRNVPVGGGLRRNKKMKQEGSPCDEQASKRYKSSSHYLSNFDINPKDAELNHLLHNLNSSPYRRGISASPSTSDLPETSDFSYALDARFHNGGEEASQRRFSENAGLAGYVCNSAAEESLQRDVTRATYQQPLGSNRVGMASDPSVCGFNISCGSTTSSLGANERRYEPREQPENKESPSPLDHQGQLQQQYCYFREDKDERQMQLASSQCSNTHEPQYQGGKLAEERLGDADLDDAFSNVVRVSYPFDWHQVSEWLFGGTGDFLYYVIPGGGGGGGGGGFDTGAT